ncbi:ankyrin [Penicillium coprophilum]|uniref:ankyrin n=1 Tax=Penicillium coprophilum TaxID=36646 RepID=UPI00238C06BB|nr:ankyrin [Penicillium coprophilum]KAJ5177912.1 ankyrin [Penicillium coprophilum]
MSDAQEVSSTGSKESTENDSIDWGQIIKDQIVAGDEKALESTLKEYPDALEARFSYQFDDGSAEAKGLTPLMLSAGLGHYAMVCMLLERGADEEATTTSGGSPAFFLAIDGGYLEILQLFFSRKREFVLTTTNKQKQNALMRAALFGKLSIIEFLLGNSAVATQKDEDGDSAFTIACFAGYLSIVKRLIACGIEVFGERDGNGRTGVLCAAWSDQLEIVKYLIGAKVGNVDDQDQTGLTVLHIASWRGNVKMINYILEISSVVLESPDDFGQTPLLIAAKKGQAKAAQALIQGGANIKHQDTNEDTALHIASKNGNAGLARILIENRKDASLEIKNESNETPLLTATVNKYYDIAVLLIDAGADINARHVDGRTALNIALENGDLSLFEALIRKQKGLSGVQDDLKVKALFVAAEKENPGMFDTLLEAGGNLEIRSDDGETALHFAARSGNCGIINSILDRKMPLIDEMDNFKKTPLLIAAENGNHDALATLLECGANVETQDDKQWTILHYAAKNGDLELVQWLLDFMPSLCDKRNNLGQTALVVAANEGQSRVVDSLVKVAASRSESYGENEKFAVLMIAASKGSLDLMKDILSKSKQLSKRKNESGDDLLFIAIKNKQEDVVRFLLTKNADLSIKDGQGSTLFHSATESGLLKTVECLLKRKPGLINEKNTENETALVIAFRKGDENVISLLLENKANIDVRDNDGRTALQSACRQSSLYIVQRLLNEGAKPTTTSDDNETPLHLAARSGDLNKVDLVLKWLSDNSEETWIAAEDNFGDTPLNDAIIFENWDVAFKLLKTQFYFPKHPSEEEVHIASEQEREKVADWLVSWVTENTSAQIQEHVDAIAYWAILNSHQDLLSALLTKGKLPILKRQDGSTWAHVAALGNNTEVLQKKFEWPKCMLYKTKKGITPAYLAAKRNHYSLLGKFLNRLDPEVALQAIIQVTAEKETLLSITAAEERPGKESSSRELLWRKLCSENMRPAIIEELRLFSETTDRLMEQAARSHIRGTGELKPLEYLLALLQDIHGEPYWEGSLEAKKSSMTGEWTILQLVVYYQFPQALWCLLSSGIYDHNSDTGLSEYNRPHGKWFNHKEKINDTIGELLITPPPIVQPLPTSSLPRTLAEFRKRDRLGNLSNQEGTIVDVFITENHGIGVQPKRAPLRKIIYDGPNEIMDKKSIESLKSLRDRIYTTEKSDGRQKPKEKRNPDTKQHSGLADGAVASQTATITPEEKKSGPNKEKTLDPLRTGDSQEHPNSRPQGSYRWIHIPVNDSDIAKPEKRTDDAAKELGRIALYVPFLSWSTRDFLTTELQPRKENFHDYGAGLDVAVDGQSKFYQTPISHGAVSLDQYYYASLQADELHKRNTDQVMTRYLQRQAISEHTPEGSSTSRSTTPGTSMRKFRGFGRNKKAQTTQANDGAEDQDGGRGEGEDKKGPKAPKAEESGDMSSNDPAVRNASWNISNQILVVNQLWLWVVDESEYAFISAKQMTVCAILLTFLSETIITTATMNDSEVRESFFDQALLRIQAQKSVPELLLSQIVEMIVDTATTSFYDVKVRLDETGKQKRSPMDIFRESLQSVRNEEASLFVEFENSLGEKAGQNSDSGAGLNDTTSPTAQDRSPKPMVTRLREWWTSLQTHALENRYQNIQNETRLLREIKDISDELRILKELVNGQEHVNGLWKKIVDVQIGRRHTIKETKDDLENMIQEAKSVEEGINTLLDLKQKQATILEARATRQQSDTVMVFTVVTIVFLPASFLTSLFALNVSDFPHQGDNVAFEGRWIFPIIFGVSLGVSTFFVWLAFNSHLFKHVLGEIWRQLKEFPSRNANSEQQEHDIEVKPNRLERLLSALWRREEKQLERSAEGNFHEPSESASSQLQKQDVGLREEGQKSQMGPDNDKQV